MYNMARRAMQVEEPDGPDKDLLQVILLVKLEASP